jgi:prepilin-type N-terminal cleavage/methylation domain-containing protein
VRVQNEAGFTLIELLVAMTLSLIVLGATLDAFAGFSRNNRAVNVKNDAQQDVRASTDQLARELRNAVSSGAPTPAPLEKATSFDLMFQTVQGSANARVRYCLADSTTTPTSERLLKQTQSPPAPAAPSTTDCPSSALGNPVTVADRLVNRQQGQNRPVFVFNYSPTSSTNLTDVTGIQTNLFVNREPGKARSTAELTSAVRLRNTNRAPTAAFTVTQQNGHVVLNSNSQDPDGESLDYQWSVDGAVITGATRSRLDYPGLASGSTHAFTLRVTDPKGLANSLTQSVVIP